MLKMQKQRNQNSSCGTNNVLGKPDRKRKRSSSLDSLNNKYQFMESGYQMKEDLDTDESNGDFQNSNTKTTSNFKDKSLNKQCKCILSTTFEIETFHPTNASCGCTSPEDTAGYLIPLCDCQDCQLQAKITYHGEDTSSGNEASSTNSSETDIGGNPKNNAKNDGNEGEASILFEVEKENGKSYRSLSDIIDALAMPDFEILPSKIEKKLSQVMIASEKDCPDELIHGCQSKIGDKNSSSLDSRMKNTTLRGKLNSSTNSTITKPKNKFFCYEQQEVASLSVSQSNILKHSTDPYHPFVCTEEEKKTSIAAQTLIDTSSLKQIIPPKSLDNIVPTTLVSTCGTITAPNVMNKGLSNHPCMVQNRSWYQNVFRQHCVYELHTIYGSTSSKLYRVTQ